MKILADAPGKSMLSLLGLGMLFGSMPAAAAEHAGFADKFTLRLASYYVERSDTDFAILDESGLGTQVNFADDLGGDDNVTIPRIDMRYRFNDRHSVDFTHYRIERSGRRSLQIDIDFDDQSYSVGETVVSEINYELYKYGYSYSFYHSPRVELDFTVGLNFTTYEFEYELADGSEADSADASAPLPMFGLRMSYAITPRWSVHYLTETFFVELDDEFEGSLSNNELDLQYRAGKHFLLGLGFARFSFDLKVDDDDLSGRVNDSHRGALFYIGVRL